MGAREMEWTEVEIADVLALASDDALLDEMAARDLDPALDLAFEAEPLLDGIERAAAGGDRQHLGVLMGRLRALLRPEPAATPGVVSLAPGNPCAGRA